MDEVVETLASKKLNGWSTNLDDFTINNELTVEITLSEYRKLLKDSITKENEIEKANKDKYERNSENEKLKKENKELEMKLFEYRKRYGELEQEETDKEVEE